MLDLGSRSPNWLPSTAKKDKRSTFTFEIHIFLTNELRFSITETKIAPDRLFKVDILLIYWFTSESPSLSRHFAGCLAWTLKWGKAKLTDLSEDEPSLLAQVGERLVARGGGEQSAVEEAEVQPLEVEEASKERRFTIGLIPVVISIERCRSIPFWWPRSFKAWFKRGKLILNILTTYNYESDSVVAYSLNG